MTSLRVERILETAELFALREDWQDLERRAQCRLPFFTFDWASCWWQHLHEHKVAITDELYVHTVRTSGGELVGVAPLMRTCRPGVGPLRAREVQFFGADPNLTELRGMLVDRRFERESYRILLDELTARESEWDWLTFSGVSTADHALQEVIRGQWSESQWVRDIADFILPLPDSWETLKGSLARNIKESLRKCYNAPKRDGYEIGIEVVRTASAVESALEHFFRFHSERASVEQGVRHNDVFASQASRRFLHDVCVKFAERDALRIFVLRLNDHPVAARVGFVLSDCLYLYYSGYDPDFGKYSVMTTAVAEAIQYAIREGLKSVNLSTGNDVSKTRWRPDEVGFREAFVLSPRPSSALTRSAYMRARKLLESQTLRKALGKRLSRRAE